jgi:hypothetical protein
MAEELSIRAYARRIGRSPKAVRKHIERGIISKTASGKIDPAKADAALRAHGIDPGTAVGTEAPVTGDPSEAEPSEDPALANLAARLAGGDLLTKAEAEQVKENYLARLRMLEVERKEARLVEVQAVVDEVAKANGIVRNGFLSLPQKVAPKVANATTAAEAREIIAAEVHDALEHLADPEATAHEKAAETAKEAS